MLIVIFLTALLIVTSCNFPMKTSKGLLMKTFSLTEAEYSRAVRKTFAQTNNRAGPLGGSTRAFKTIVTFLKRELRMTDAELSGVFKHYPTMFTLDPRHVAQRVFFLLNDQSHDQEQEQDAANKVNDDAGNIDGDDDDDADDEDDEDDDDRPAPIAPPPFLRNMGYSVFQLKRLLANNPRAIFYSEKHFESLRRFFREHLDMTHEEFCQVNRQ